VDIEEEPYRLTKARILQILGDAAFYHRCPLYLFMEDMGRATAVEYAAAVGRAGKGPDKSHAIAAPAITAFVRHTVRLHDSDPQLLQQLRAYLEERLSYQPHRFLLTFSEQSCYQYLDF